MVLGCRVGIPTVIVDVQLQTRYALLSKKILSVSKEIIVVVVVVVVVVAVGAVATVLETSAEGNKKERSSKHPASQPETKSSERPGI